jgi:hypothetical protein
VHTHILADHRHVSHPDRPRAAMMRNNGLMKAPMTASDIAPHAVRTVASAHS